MSDFVPNSVRSDTTNARVERNGSRDTGRRAEIASGNGLRYPQRHLGVPWLPRPMKPVRRVGGVPGVGSTVISELQLPDLVPCTRRRVRHGQAHPNDVISSWAASSTPGSVASRHRRERFGFKGTGPAERDQRRERLLRERDRMQRMKARPWVRIVIRPDRGTLHRQSPCRDLVRRGIPHANVDWAQPMPGKRFALGTTRHAAAPGMVANDDALLPGMLRVSSCEAPSRGSAARAAT